MTTHAQYQQNLQTSSSNDYTTNYNKNWQLNSSPSISSKGLKIGFLNATSLKKYIWDFRQYLINDNSYDIFCVAETRLGSEVDDNIIQIPGYSTVRQDRNIRGGGILLYIKEHLKAKLLFTSKTEHPGKPLKPEFMFCSVWEGTSTPVLIVLKYHPLDVSIRSDRQLIELLRSTSSNFSHKAVIGDWNVDMLTPDDSDTRFLNDIMSEMSLKLVNTGPSHHTTKRSKANNTQTNTDDLSYTELSDNDESLDNRDLSTNDELSDNNLTKDTWIDSIFVDECEVSHIL